MTNTSNGRLHIAVVGTGISGMAAAWLLSKAHDVAIFEGRPRPGGHSNTVDVPTRSGALPVDTGFIVYNEVNYPNLTALFAHLGIATKPSEMSFAVSLDAGRLEYSGGVDLRGLFAQRRNALSPRFWSMLSDLRRFYANAPQDVGALGGISLGEYLATKGYGAPFCEDHLLPMAAAIWSSPADTLLDYPAEAFIQFFDNHGLLKVTGRPAWRTVVGGSRSYVRRLMAGLEGRVRYGARVRAIHREPAGVGLDPGDGTVEWFDHVVIAAHADEALAMLCKPSAREAALLGAFQHSENEAVLHSDETLMPQRHKVWASWNYIGEARTGDEPCVTYWMNRLQGLPAGENIFVTLNPAHRPREGSVFQSETYHHPIFNRAALDAQCQLWSLQGQKADMVLRGLLRGWVSRRWTSGRPCRRRGAWGRSPPLDRAQ